MPASQATSREPRGTSLPTHWEMVSSFVLSLRDGPPPRRKGHCILEPIATALEPFHLEDDFLCEISQGVEQTGMEMRDNCPEGKLVSVNVRVYATSQAPNRLHPDLNPWRFFVVKQIASSESDNLNAFEEPYCYIDLHVYQQA